MSTVQTWQATSADLDATLALAAQIARKLRGGETIVLSSDLGGGKTAFVRGLARGLGSTDAVRSPSFTLTNEYKAADLTLYHYDFYRLSQAGIMRDELAEVVADPKAVAVIEWADIVADVLPPKHLAITIEVTGETSRQFTFSYPADMAYLVC